jgi:hypothetical protein
VQPQKKLPLWHNVAVENNYAWNKKAAKCLRRTNRVKTIGDLLDRNDGERQNCHKEACQTMARTLITNLPEIINPELTTPEKTKDRNLDHTPK